MARPSPAALHEVASTCVCAKMRRLSRVVTKTYEEAMRPTGLKATQVTLLIALAHADEIPTTRLGEILGMDRTTLTRNLVPLERNGLLSVGGSKTDGRRRMVRMTVKGEHALERALPLWRAVQRRTLARIGGAERWSELSQALTVLES